MPNIANAVEARSRANVPASVTSASIEGTLNAVEGLVEAFVGFDPRHAEAAEWYSAGGELDLVLDRRPVTAVASVYELTTAYFQSGNLTSAHLLTAGTDWALAQQGVGKVGVLRRLNARWPYAHGRGIGRLASELEACPGCVRVTYSAGLQGSALAAVEEAVYAEFATRYQMRPGGLGPVSSESLDGFSYSRTAPPGADSSGSPFVNPAAFQILRAYRRIPIARG